MKITSQQTRVVSCSIIYQIEWKEANIAPAYKKGDKQ